MSSKAAWVTERVLVLKKEKNKKGMWEKLGEKVFLVILSLGLESSGPSLAQSTTALPSPTRSEALYSSKGVAGRF